MNGVIYVVGSNNSKLLGAKPIDATYVSIQSSCPKSCKLKNGNGCYAEAGNVGMHCRRLDSEAEDFSPIQMAQAEAKAIDEAYKGGSIPADRMLRLHVSGDSRTIKGSRIINKAIGRWLDRGGKSAYTYTHSWQHVSRYDWSNVSIFASVDNIDQVKQAYENGYAPAIVVPEHPSDKPYVLTGSDTIWIPCPSQREKNPLHCSNCGLCSKADKLRDSGKGIAFAAHGVKKTKLRLRLLEGESNG